MLEANKSRWAENIFAVYNRNLLRRRFDSLRVSGLQKLINGENLPTIIYANHSAWWDGLVAFQISRQMRLDSFIMMEEKQLAQLFFFRRLGAFSVVRENPRQAMKSLEYAVKILTEKPGRTLWIFPQGEILPNDLRPLKFYQGLARMLKTVNDCRIINLALRYEFLKAFKPEIFVRVDEIFLENKVDGLNYKKISPMLADALTANLDRLKIDIIDNQTNEYKNII